MSILTNKTDGNKLTSSWAEQQAIAREKRAKEKAKTEKEEAIAKDIVNNENFESTESIESLKKKAGHDWPKK